LTIGNATISDAHPHGALSVAQVIQKSSNVGAAKIAAMLPSQTMWQMFDDVGFGQAPRLGFPGKSPGAFGRGKPGGRSSRRRCRMGMAFQCR
jgi:cell division protein FtsI (penicillin-binding protein 3)